MSAALSPKPRALPWPRLTLIGCLLLLGGCAYAIVSGGRVNEAKVAKIEGGIQDLRELRFKSPVPIVVKSQDDAEAIIEAEMMRDYSGEQLQAEGAAGVMMGLLPAGTDLKSSELSLLKSQVAGFYDPRGKQMVLVEGITNVGFLNSTAEFFMQRDVAGEMLLAHELTHALQDQNLNLQSSLDRVKDDDDRSIALKAVAEGDATLAGFAYAMGGMSNANADLLAEQLKDLPTVLAEQSPGTPDGLTVPLAFQYSEGVKFVGEAYHRGGWAAVDALYRNPPQSSHQILHPSLYFTGTPAVPPEIHFPDYEKIMPGWKTVDQDTIGELLIRVILENNLGKQSKDAALAAVWTADRAVILKRDREFAVIWMVSFRNASWAGQFAAAYARVLDRVNGAATQHRVGTRGDTVMVTIGKSTEHFDSLWPANGESSAPGHMSSPVCYRPVGPTAIPDEKKSRPVKRPLITAIGATSLLL
ncbi:MAG TPA: hypothetical protein VMU16_05950 [Candidatus Binataceae bacterium]|nr:hypothetical protein [Candidatus Binataceae bacterium]